ncbi:hypothetical protein [Comamonas sp. NLF-1-9]|uniref:hypothetical protein n=1 Tax=Comamonas sp. NLF-1-9 TaxID=2853163 RepID=UPI001C47A8F7|nr:hypothetical protein [Comamonas sp. NLF-1-9]QXL84534.1 hypothetical protein KUD94_00590 [Comamonas sp. NLF-1-9]
MAALTLSTGGLALLLAWRLSQAPSAAAALAGALVWLASALLAWRWWRAGASGVLQWDTQQWLLCGEGGDAVPCGAPEVCLDLQRLMLVRVRPQGRAAQWLWLQHRGPAQGWSALRRAVFAGGAQARAAAVPAPVMAPEGRT